MAKKQKRKTASKHIIGFILTILLVAALTCGIIVLIKQLEADKSEKDNVQDKNTASNILETEEDLKDEEKVAQSSNDAKDRMDADEEAKEKTTVAQDESGKKIAKPEISFRLALTPCRTQATSLAKQRASIKANSQAGLGQ